MLLPGPNAYRQAYEHGVKVAGVTAHFVNMHLDEGLIVISGILCHYAKNDPQGRGSCRTGQRDEGPCAGSPPVFDQTSGCPLGHGQGGVVCRCVASSVDLGHRG